MALRWGERTAKKPLSEHRDTSETTEIATEAPRERLRWKGQWLAVFELEAECVPSAAQFWCNRRLTQLNRLSQPTYKIRHAVM